MAQPRVFGQQSRPQEVGPEAFLVVADAMASFDRRARWELTRNAGMFGSMLANEVSDALMVSGARGRRLAGRVRPLRGYTPGVTLGSSRFALATAYGHDFGGGDRVTTYLSRRGGSTFEVTRHTTRQFGRKSYGDSSKYVYPAIAATVPRILDWWADEVVAVVDEVIDRRLNGNNRFRPRQR